MKDLLVQAVRRVCGLDGEPVIQLKTALERFLNENFHSRRHIQPHGTSL